MVVSVAAFLSLVIAAMVLVVRGVGRPRPGSHRAATPGLPVGGVDWLITLLTNTEII